MEFIEMIMENISILKKRGSPAPPVVVVDLRIVRLQPAAPQGGCPRDPGLLVTEPTVTARALPTPPRLSGRATKALASELSRQGPRPVHY